MSALINHNIIYRDKYTSLFKCKMNISDLKFSHLYLDKLYRDINRQKDNVSKSREKADQAKKQLREAMRDRKKYDRLKERRRFEYEYEAGREEQKELDEIASGPKSNLSTKGMTP